MSKLHANIHVDPQYTLHLSVYELFACSELNCNQCFRCTEIEMIHSCPKAALNSKCVGYQIPAILSLYPDQKQL